MRHPFPAIAERRLCGQLRSCGAGFSSKAVTLPEPFVAFHATLHPSRCNFAYFRDAGFDLRPKFPVCNRAPGYSHSGCDLLIRLAVLGNHLRAVSCLTFCRAAMSLLYRLFVNFCANMRRGWHEFGPLFVGWRCFLTEDESAQIVFDWLH